MKFRKKPVVIEALQWKGDNWDELEKLFPRGMTQMSRHLKYRQIAIETLEGEMIAECGDWIIKGIKDEIYPCKPDIFEMTYEKVKETTRD